jgi:diguanylate cyclase (GGDEF)-like protein
MNQAGGHSMNQRLGRVLDGTICAAGCLVSLVVALPWIRRPETLPIGTVVVALAIVALSRVPMRLPSRAGMVEITFAPAALVYLSLRGSVSSTALLWLVVSTIMFLGERHKPLSDRVFNIGCVSLSGVVLLGIVSLRNGLLKPSTLLLVALGCAAFFLVDLFLTMLTLSVARGVVMSEVLEPSRCVVPLVCFIGIDSLGYLAALLQRAYPAWAMGLLAVPLLTIFVALRSLDRARESERRTQAIYAIVKAASGVDSSPDITNLLEASLSDLMPNRTVLIRDEPPGELEIGAALSLEGTPSRWLIVLQGRAYGFTPSEVETVEALTTVSVEMLERQQLVGKITQLARFDVLTGLTNRSVFLDRLELALDRLTRGGGSVAVLYCDLDGFKGVNDRLGHEAGDHVIVAVADRLRAQLRPSDTASRLGGDEFAVLVEDVRDVEIARSLAERIVEALRPTRSQRGRRLHSRRLRR